MRYLNNMLGTIGNTPLVALDNITKELGGFRANQFHNPSTYRAAEIGIAHEVLQQIQDPIDIFADFMGTGGSFIGVTMKLKEYLPNIKFKTNRLFLMRIRRL